MNTLGLKTCLTLKQVFYIAHDILFLQLSGSPKHSIHLLLIQLPFRKFADLWFRDSKKEAQFSLVAQALIYCWSMVLVVVGIHFQDKVSTERRISASPTGDATNKLGKKHFRSRLTWKQPSHWAALNLSNPASRRETMSHSLTCSKSWTGRVPLSNVETRGASSFTAEFFSQLTGGICSFHAGHHTNVLRGVICIGSGSDVLQRDKLIGPGWSLKGNSEFEKKNKYISEHFMLACLTAVKVLVCSSKVCFCVQTNVGICKR